MKSKKIFAGLVLAVFLFAIPQAIADASDIRGEYSGALITRPYDPIKFEITSGDTPLYGERPDGSLAGTIGDQYEINLVLLMHRPDLGRRWYIGTLTTSQGQEYEFRMIVCHRDGAIAISGSIQCRNLGLLSVKFGAILV